MGGYFSTLWNAVLGKAPGAALAERSITKGTGFAPRAAPGRAPQADRLVRPADPAALKAARDGIVGGLFPGRSWGDLTDQEKQQVVDRLNGR